MTTTQTPRNYRRIAAGDYQSDDGIRIYRVPGINPPAWNAYRTNDDGTDTDIADGAATFADARAIADADCPADS